MSNIKGSNSSPVFDCSQKNFANWRKETCRAFSSVQFIDNFPSYENFFQHFLMTNRPCIFSSQLTDEWRSRIEWILPNGQPDFSFLQRNFGDAVVPIADCKKQKFYSQPKTDMRLSDYLEYWKHYIAMGHPEEKECLYLKDWHFVRDFPEYKAYQTPVYFASDWLNEYWDFKNSETKDGEMNDDYRFVYMGPKGSWTPFHADVFRSYSWSANICGRKRWILYPPGQEKMLIDKFGQLAYDVTSPAVADKSKYPMYDSSATRVEVIQEAGEVIFVPSGWHHQVFNLEDTISINHNWLNGCNVDICWDYIKDNLIQVQKEIEDCRDMEEWDNQCQVILNASTGIDYMGFLHLMDIIAENRFKCIKNYASTNVCQKDRQIAYSQKGKNCESHNAVNITEHTMATPSVLSHSSGLGAECGIQTPNVKQTLTSSTKDTVHSNLHTATVLNVESDDKLQNVHLSESENKLLSGYSKQVMDSSHDEELPTPEQTTIHSIFDLRRVAFILIDMLKTDEFKHFDFTEVSTSPKSLLNDINKVLTDEDSPCV